jgi:hypothetical protein
LMPYVTLLILIIPLSLSYLNSFAACSITSFTAISSVHLLFPIPSPLIPYPSLTLCIITDNLVYCMILLSSLFL